MKIIPRSIVKDREIGIAEMSVTYTQNPDTNSRSDEYQYLTVKAVPCDMSDADYKEGDEPCSYYNVEIGSPYEEDTDSSKHWSIEDPEEIANIVRDFINRYKLVSNFDKNNE